MVAPRVPLRIAAFPDSTGIETFSIMRMTKTLPRRRRLYMSCTGSAQRRPSWVVGRFPVTRQTRHKATFATPLSENMNEDFTVELPVGLLGESTGCSRPTKASNIGDGRFQPDAPNLRVAMTRGSKLLVLCSK